MLKVWLPLNKDLRNIGTSDLKFSIISQNTTLSSNGFFGSCYSNNSNTVGGIVSDKKINLGQKQSMFCWIKLNNICSSSSLQAVLGQHRYRNCTGMGLTMRYLSATTAKLSVNTGDGSSRTYNTYVGNTILNSNTWYHIGYTYDNGTIKLYVNGNLDGTYTGIISSIVEDFIQIFGWAFESASYTNNTVYSNYKVNGDINDVRIYDHCLSEKEIKDLAKGLCVHYKLSDPYVENTENLFKAVTSVQTTRCEKYGNGFMVKTVSGDAYAGMSLYSQLISGNTYQISFDVDMNESDICSFGLYYSSTMNHVIPIHKGRNVMTVTPSITLSSITFDDTNRSNSSPIYLTNFLIEEKDHATPYTPSSRTTTIVRDNSGFGYDATVINTLTVKSLSIRNTHCTHFETAALLSSDINLPGDKPFSIMAWVRLTTAQKYQPLFWLGNGRTAYGICMHGSGSTRLEGGKTSTVTTAFDKTIGSLSLNTWRHVALTWDEENIRVYYNGSLAYTLSWTSDFSDTFKRLYVGHFWGGKIKGDISDVRVYATALSANDIVDICKVAAYIDNTLNLYCYELNEENSKNQIDKTGVFETPFYSEALLDNFDDISSYTSDSAEIVRIGEIYSTAKQLYEI